MGFSEQMFSTQASVSCHCNDPLISQQKKAFSLCHLLNSNPGLRFPVALRAAMCTRHSQFCTLFAGNQVKVSVATGFELKVRPTVASHCSVALRVGGCCGLSDPA